MRAGWAIGGAVEVSEVSGGWRAVHGVPCVVLGAWRVVECAGGCGAHGEQCIANSRGYVSLNARRESNEWPRTAV